MFENDLIKTINESDCLRIMLDETCDTGIDKRLFVSVRYVAYDEAKTAFLANVKISDGKAHTIAYLVHGIYLNYGIKMS